MSDDVVDDTGLVGVQRSAWLWDEYKYRHDHIWKLCFQLTAATVILSVIPYVRLDIVRTLGLWVLALPVLALVLLLFGLLVLRQELKLFAVIRQRYQAIQAEHLQIEHPPSVNLLRFALVYLSGLMLLGVANCGVLALIWVPHAAVMN